MGRFYVHLLAAAKQFEVLGKKGKPTGISTIRLDLFNSGQIAR